MSTDLPETPRAPMSDDGVGRVPRVKPTRFVRPCALASGGLRKVLTPLEKRLLADKKKKWNENQQWLAGYEPRVAATHARSEMVGPTVPEIVHPWNVTRRRTGRIYPWSIPGVPPPPPKEWYNLVCDFEDPLPPTTLSFTSADIAKIATREMGAPELAPKIKFMLQRVDAWRYADQEKATVELSMHGLPTHREKMDPNQHIVWGGEEIVQVTGSSIVLEENWDAARCSFVMPGIMADQALGMWSDAKMITVRGNTQLTQIVRFHILWTYRQQSQDLGQPAPKV